MQTSASFRRPLSLLLTGVLLCRLLLPAAASELPEEPLPQEAAVTEPSVPETTAAPTEETVTESTEAPEPQLLPTLPDETVPADPEPAFSCPYNLYFGLLHAHTTISDGLGSVEEAFSHAAGVEGLDFFAVTDHSNSFDNADAGSINLDGSALSQEWAAGKAAAAAVTGDTFLGIFGYEMTWPEIRQLGHIVTFGTPGWISRDQAGFANDADALAHYFEALSTVPGSVSQFCHPGALYGDFDGFRQYQADWDTQIQLLETIGEGSIGSYIQALDRFWHVAPTATQNNHNGRFGDKNEVRTVVLAEELTEDSLFDAIRLHRVYATEDRDLHIFYQLDRHMMGSVLSVSEHPEITVSLYDPTDESIGTVEVIAEGGVTLASQTAERNDTQLTLSVPGGYRWYFLKITQPDGDIAVTAPVWVEGFANMGISAFGTQTRLPVQNQPLELYLTLFNAESVDFALTELELYAGDTLVHAQESPGTVAAGTDLTFRISYTHPDAGTAELRAIVRGTVLGKQRTYQADLTLRLRSGETVTGMLIDGCHNPTVQDLLERLKDLAVDAGLDVTVFLRNMPQGGSLLVIPPLLTDPDPGFWEDLRAFVQAGGSLILLGGSGENSRGNQLLETIGSALRFGSDTIPAGSCAIFRTDSPWCAGLKEGQVFRHPEGCSVSGGSWLVKAASGDAVLLACEETGQGGTIFAAGSTFLLDELLPQTRSIWDLPPANQTILQAILGAEVEVLALQTIRQVRSGEPGSTVRVKGYITSGTANPHTTFPDTVYMQDTSGGIAVKGFSVPDIPVGTAIEIIGILRTENGNSVLEYTDHRLPEEAPYRFVPKTQSCKAATDYDAHGGELMQVEGTVTELTLTADRRGISRLVVKDHRGYCATIEIEESIRSGSSGLNRLAKDIKKGRTVRCMGLLHINEDGEPVLRVRNCDEVVYVPPEADPTNPKTGDRTWRICPQHWTIAGIFCIINEIKPEMEAPL